jgi:glycosyltransferase involved in cell wall biosynthesis
MSDGLLASIIVSSYNYGRFLKEAIDSALGQTYPHTEVIVVDDGSTDNSREVIAGYGDRIRPVLKDNGGQASAFNAGFAASRGQAIFFLDSDDVLLPTAVENAVEFFHNPDVAKVHWPLLVIDEHSRETEKLIGVNLPEGNLLETLIQNGPDGYGWPPTSGSAWGRSFLERVFPMPEAEYKTCPDLYLAALAPLFGLVKKNSEPQGFWRAHQVNNSWRESFEERMRAGLWRTECCFRTLRQYCEEMGIHPVPENWRQNSWWHQIESATQTISNLIPPGETFILVNEDEWASGETIAGRRRLSFPDQNGYFGGLPPDDASAIAELERLRQAGANFIVFVWPYLWWLDHYAGLREYLQTSFLCLAETDRLVVFDLRNYESGG